MQPLPIDYKPTTPKRKGAKWIHISKTEIKVMANDKEIVVSAGNGTYYRPNPKPLNKKERRKIAKQNAQRTA